MVVAVVEQGDDERSQCGRGNLIIFHPNSGDAGHNARLKSGWLMLVVVVVVVTVVVVVVATAAAATTVGSRFFFFFFFFLRLRDAVHPASQEVPTEHLGKNIAHQGGVVVAGAVALQALEQHVFFIFLLCIAIAIAIAITIAIVEISLGVVRMASFLEPSRSAASSFGVVVVVVVARIPVSYTHLTLPTIYSV